MIPVGTQDKAMLVTNSKPRFHILTYKKAIFTLCYVFIPSQKS